MSNNGRIDLEKFRAFGKRQRQETKAGRRDPLIVQRAKIRLVKDQLKEARVGKYRLVCDEPESRGGTGQGPTPLQFFTASIGF